MFATIRITHSRTVVRDGQPIDGRSAHLEDTQFTGTGGTRDEAITDLMHAVAPYGWSTNPDDYQIFEGHGHPAL